MADTSPISSKVSGVLNITIGKKKLYYRDRRRSSLTYYYNENKGMQKEEKTEE